MRILVSNDDNYIYCELSQRFYAKDVKAIHVGDKVYKAEVHKEFEGYLELDDGELLRLRYPEKDESICSGIEIKKVSVEVSRPSAHEPNEIIAITTTRTKRLKKLIIK